ncbi:MAG: hypothetical protein JXA52_08160 [Planctomycetes bacterium]|nr:hypothetical protein [Planctomycetota bacterium]
MRKAILLIGVLIIASAPVFAAADMKPAIPDIRIQMLAPELPDEELLTVPWVAEDDDSWAEGEPLCIPSADEYQEFNVKEGEEPITDHVPQAFIWMGVTNKNIKFKVIVDDDIQHNPMENQRIWQCDSIQIGIDAQGNGTGVLPEETILVQPDDIGTAFALTKDGPKGWAHYCYDRDKRGDLPSEMMAITRDDEHQLTTYVITIPWEKLATSPGISPLMGVVIKVNDTDHDSVDETDVQKYTRDKYKHRRRELFFGNGNREHFRPGLFQLVKIGNPPAEYFSSLAAQTKLWRDSDEGGIVFAYATDQQVTALADFNGIIKDLPLPATKLTDGLQRVSLKVFPNTFLAEKTSFKGQLVNAAGQELISQEGMLYSASAPINKLHNLLMSLTRTSPHPVFTRHLRSIDTLVQAEWLRVSHLFDSQPDEADYILEQVDLIMDALENGDAADWEAYRGRRRQMLFTFRSRLDATIQFYKVLLPQDWDETKTYPLIVQLHGRGDPRPITSSMEQYRVPTSPGIESFIEEDRQTYTIHPFGRGNHGYIGFSEYDVFEAMRDMQATFKTDEERTFLSGGSMGGMGTWAVGSRNPDYWAAIELRAAAPRSAPVGIGLGGNLTGVPVHIWHGEKDYTVPIKGGFQIAEELRRNHQDYVFETNPEGGHDAPREDRAEIYKWLLQPSHVRQRPQNFSYVVDSHNHYGRLGIKMKRVPEISALPRFDCEIKDNEVHIYSQGTPEIELDFSEDGLALEGEVVIFWNGEEVYKGPARKLKLLQEKTAKVTTEYL